MTARTSRADEDADQAESHQAAEDAREDEDEGKVRSLLDEDRPNEVVHRSDDDRPDEEEPPPAGLAAPEEVADGGGEDQHRTDLRDAEDEATVVSAETKGMPAIDKAEPRQERLKDRRDDDPEGDSPDRLTCEGGPRPRPGRRPDAARSAGRGGRLLPVRP